MQLWPLFCSRIVATCSAWKRRSARDHSPGTMMIGETPPSSAVIGTDSPGTIARNVASDPVMCTCAIDGCLVRYAPTSPPPRTIRRKPGSISGASARSKTGTRASCVGFTLRIATRLHASSSYMTSR